MSGNSTAATELESRTNQFILAMVNDHIDIMAVLPFLKSLRARLLIEKNIDPIEFIIDPNAKTGDDEIDNITDVIEAFSRLQSPRLEALSIITRYKQLTAQLNAEIQQATAREKEVLNLLLKATTALESQRDLVETLEATDPSILDRASAKLPDRSRAHIAALRRNKGLRFTRQPDGTFTETKTATSSASSSSSSQRPRKKPRNRD